MSSWQQFDPTDLYPSEVATAIDSFDDVVNALSTALGALGTVIDVISTFAQGVSDINEALIKAAQDLIVSIFQQMTQTGVYWLFHMSPSFSYRMTPQQWVSQVAASLYDRMDERRPAIVDGSDWDASIYVGGVAILATSENLKDLLTDYYQLMELFQNALASLTQIQSWKDPYAALEVVPGIGRAPNWNSKKVVDIIPGLSEIAEKMLGFANTIAGPNPASDIYSGFVDALAAKAAYLTNFVTSIQNILNAISVILNFEGAFVLPIYGQGDLDWLSSQLTNSTGGPLDVDGANYSIGAMFLALGGTSQPADTLFDLFGLAKEVTP